MKKIFRSDSGFSVTELMLSMGAAGFALAALTVAVIYNSQFVVSTQNRAENVSQLTLLRVHLAKIRNRAFHKPVFLNQEVIDAVIGPGVPLGTVTGSFSSILPLKNVALDLSGGKVALVPTPGADSAIILIAKTQGKLTVAADPSKPGLPYDFSDSETKTGKIYFTGGGSTLKSGDYASINSGEAVQIVRIVSIGGGSFNFETIGKYSVGYSETRMPLGLVALGSKVTELGRYLVGPSSNGQRLRLIELSGVDKAVALLDFKADSTVSLKFLSPPTPTNPQDRGIAPFSGAAMLVMNFTQTDKMGMLTKSELSFSF